MSTYWNQISLIKSRTKKNKTIDSIGIGLASAEEIRRWGERQLPNGTFVGKVGKDHTVDYESLKPIEGGLFCERIFGPVEDFYCSCERRGERNEKFCPTCEVEFTKSRVRRIRMGYIPLAVPVVHVWYLRGRPSYVANLVGKSRNAIDRLAYGETLSETYIGNTHIDFYQHDIQSPKVLSSFLSPPNFKIPLEEKIPPSFVPRCYPAKEKKGVTPKIYISYRGKQNKVYANLPCCFPYPEGVKLLTSRCDKMSKPRTALVGAQQVFQRGNSSAPKIEDLLLFLLRRTRNKSLMSTSSKSSLLGAGGLSSLNLLERKQGYRYGITIKTPRDIRLKIYANFAKQVLIHPKDHFHFYTSHALTKLIKNCASFSQEKERNPKENVDSLYAATLQGLPSFACPTGLKKSNIHNNENISRKVICKNDSNSSVSFFGGLSSYPERVKLRKPLLASNIEDVSPKEKTCSDVSLPEVIKLGILGTTYEKTKSCLKNSLLHKFSIFEKQQNCESFFHKIEKISPFFQNFGEIARKTLFFKLHKDNNKKWNFNNWNSQIVEKYNKFHTLPLFSTFVYKEWSHRFSFLDYFLWPAQNDDLILPFYASGAQLNAALDTGLPQLLIPRVGTQQVPLRGNFDVRSNLRRSCETEGSPVPYTAKMSKSPKALVDIEDVSSESLMVEAGAPLASHGMPIDNLPSSANPPIWKPYQAIRSEVSATGQPFLASDICDVKLKDLLVVQSKSEMSTSSSRTTMRNNFINAIKNKFSLRFINLNDFEIQAYARKNRVTSFDKKKMMYKGQRSSNFLHHPLVDIEVPPKGDLLCTTSKSPFGGTSMSEATPKGVSASLPRKAPKEVIQKGPLLQTSRIILRRRNRGSKSSMVEAGGVQYPTRLRCQISVGVDDQCLMPIPFEENTEGDVETIKNQNLQLRNKDSVLIFKVTNNSKPLSQKTFVSQLPRFAIDIKDLHTSGSYASLCEANQRSISSANRQNSQSSFGVNPLMSKIETLASVAYQIRLLKNTIRFAVSPYRSETSEQKEPRGVKLLIPRVGAQQVPLRGNFDVRSNPQRDNAKISTPYRDVERSRSETLEQEELLLVRSKSPSGGTSMSSSAGEKKKICVLYPASNIEDAAFPPTEDNLRFVQQAPKGVTPKEEKVLPGYPCKAKRGDKEVNASLSPLPLSSVSPYGGLGIKELAQETSLNSIIDTQQFPRLEELLNFTGGTALRQLLCRFDLISLSKLLRHELKNLELKVNNLLALKMLTYSQGFLLGKLAKRRSKQIRRLKLLELFQSQKSNPEWMILSVLPVLPPDLRPILRVNDDFVVASDLNRLYQTVLRRNNTIHEKLDDPLPCPESGLFRQRSLQKAVDGLLENGKGGGTPLCASKRRPLVSLSHVLKGKKGLFRQHLLGKRVDYSGRSVIVVGPKLRLYECGLPKEMAVELFQPFLLHRLKIKGLATSNMTARRMIQQEDPVIWHILKQLVYEHPILLNRAPTLHRLGIQAFQPRLVSGRAILLHPLVCNGFNADFDGDQMAVHVPLSFQARAEAWKIMWSKNNLLSPATGQPILVPSQDMVLGCYYLSVAVPRVLSFLTPTVSTFDKTGINFSKRNPFPPYTPTGPWVVEEDAQQVPLRGNFDVRKNSSDLKPWEVQYPQRLLKSYLPLTGLFCKPHYPRPYGVCEAKRGKEGVSSETSEQKGALVVPPTEDAQQIPSFGRDESSTSLALMKQIQYPSLFPNPKNKNGVNSFHTHSFFPFLNKNQGHYFSNLRDSLLAYFQNRLQTHTSFWVRIDSFLKHDSNVLNIEPSEFYHPFRVAKDPDPILSKGLFTSKAPVVPCASSACKASASLPIKSRKEFDASLQERALVVPPTEDAQQLPSFGRKVSTALGSGAFSSKIILQKKRKALASGDHFPRRFRGMQIEDVNHQQENIFRQTFLEPQYGSSREICKIMLQTYHHHPEIIIEGNESLEAPLELRISVHGNLAEILTTFQYHYDYNATVIDQYKGNSIKYMRTTAGRVIINKAIF